MSRSGYQNMRYKDTVIKVLLPYYDCNGQKQINLMRLDARGTSIDIRRIRRELRKWYKQALGISLPECLLKNPRFIQLIVDDPMTNYDDAELDKAVDDWIMKIHLETDNNEVEN